MRRWLAVGAAVAGFAFGVGARSTVTPPAPVAQSSTHVGWTATDACALEDCSVRTAGPTATTKPTPTLTEAPIEVFSVAPSHPVAPATPRPASANDDAWQASGYVAHAFGSPADGTPYTNSMEAFELSYANGFRVFEIDLVLLGDGNVLLAHDRFEQRYGLPGGVRFGDVTTDVMRGRMLDGRYPVLFGDDLVSLVRRYPDTFFVLDTKDDHLAIASWFVQRLTPDELDRLRPHVHRQSQIDGLRALYDWKGFVIAAYTWTQDPANIERSAIALATRNRITTLMIRDEMYSDTLRDHLREAGIVHLYLHSFGDPVDIVRWRSRGLGVYSNGWIG